MPSHGPVVIVLAAGRGSRFRASGGQGSKLQADLHGRPVLDHVLAAVECTGLTVHAVRRAAGDGMADSIAEGVRATPDASAWLVLPGDLPLVLPESISRVAAALADSPIVVPTFHGKAGHPVGFARQCFDDLISLSGDAGGKSIVQHYRADGYIVELAVDDPGICMDVDTLEDLRRAEKMLG